MCSLYFVGDISGLHLEGRVVCYFTPLVSCFFFGTYVSAIDLFYFLSRGLRGGGAGEAQGVGSSFRCRPRVVFSFPFLG